MSSPLKPLPRIDTPAPAQPEEKEPPVDSLLASANVEAGQNAAKACGACHNFAKGAGAKVGPDLYAVVDRNIGSEPGFSYSSALQKHKADKWTFQTLYEWIKNPKAFIPGNNMGFPGIKILRREPTLSHFSINKAIIQSLFLINSALTSLDCPVTER